MKSLLLTGVAAAALMFMPKAFAQPDIAQPVVPGFETTTVPGNGQAPFTTFTPMGTSAHPIYTTGGGTGSVASSVSVLAALGTPLQTTGNICTTTSGALFTASTATVFVLIQNSAANSSTVYLNYAGAAVSLGGPNISLAPGQSQLWSSGTGYVPTGQINCSASAAATMSVVYK